MVTGATGFVGRRLVGSLLAAGDDVHAVVRRPDHRLGCPVTVAEDPLDATACGDAARDFRAEVVVNLLAAGVDPTDRDPERLVAANVLFPARLARAAAAAGAKAFVHLGSSAEYAPGPEGERLDEAAPIESERLYGSTKAAGTLLARSVGEASFLPTAVLRAFNMFGAGEKPHRLFPAVAGKLSRGEPVDLSAGTQVRDFLSVEDACAAIRRMAAALLAGDARPGIYNLASGVPLTVAAFVAQLAEILAADPALLRYGVLPMRPDEIPTVVGATDRLDAAIGPALQTDLRTALTVAIDQLNLERAHHVDA
ncbi:NAD(P)-dependent oxidoreductase [Aurantimonas sp. HBX-1]|uniref:NAD-dependent epimerase/dehydratase family protein n=1 Tax=Aurantimonas sp. HBX-1 TaxID=2906072 RepID=UPI001F3A7077|nr:NAD-dependent epimerase/dehydratase family protein [Aurantimonas sp. HBX-1]UIJ71067.1 NAD-dependent epimerase/dehydratase family protein [Aurantimonas sp. HBX-1]